MIIYIYCKWQTSFFSIKKKKRFNKITDHNKMNKKSVWEKNTYGDY